MNRNDCVRLLAYCAAMDNRNVTEETVVAWLATIGDLDVSDAMTAAREHYRERAEYLTPAVLVKGVRKIRSARLERWLDPLPAADPSDTAAYKAELLANRQAHAAGADIAGDLPSGPIHPEVESLIQQIGVTQP